MTGSARTMTTIMTKTATMTSSHARWQDDLTEVWLHKDITRRIQFYLKKKDRSLAWLSRETGVQYQALASRTAITTRWSVYDVYLCADALGLRLSDLLPPLEEMQ